MATEQVLVTTPTTIAERAPGITRQGWKLVRELPTLPVAILLLVAVAAIFAPLLAPHDPEISVKPVRVLAPAVWSGGSWQTPLGTDFQGRDVLSRLIYGARTSLIIGLLGTVFAGVVGVTMGVISGYMGGLWDQVIMRITDAKLALPALVFGIFLAAVLKPGLWTIILILMIVFWTRYARVIRGEVLSLRERDFVRLAEVTGASKLRIMFRHIVPNILNTTMVLFSLTVGVAIILEASLSFLGVGVPPPTPTWGNMLAEARPLIISERWTLTVAPGVCIMLLVLAANLLGDWLRVRLDPQLRNR
jgi:peptide/nickel transport system permease protein